MNAIQTGRLVAATALLTLSVGISAHAAPKADAKAPALTINTTVKTTASNAVVKIGDALLEEYRGGDPATRTLTIRQGDAAANPGAGHSKHS